MIFSKRPSFNHRAFIESILGSEEAEKFAEWAWGKEFRTIISPDLVKKWNELHGDKFLLDAFGSPKEDIPNMIELWKKENSISSFSSSSLPSHPWYISYRVPCLLFLGALGLCALYFF